MENKPKYDASNIIKVPSGLDAIRAYPGMYMGHTEDCSNLVFMVLDEFKRAIEDEKGTQYSNVSIIIYENNEVEISINESVLSTKNVEGRSKLEKLMTEFCHFYSKRHGGFGMSGLVVVNALSSKVLIITTNEGNIWNQIYNNGIPEPLKKNGKATCSGTTIRFLPNKKYFTNLYFNQTKIAARLEELSYLHEGLSIGFEDRSIRKAHFHNPRGLIDYIIKLIPDTKNCKIRIDPVQIIDKNNDLKIKAILVFSEGYGNQSSFVNNEKTIEGGTHQKGLIAGIAHVFKIVSGYKQSAAIWKPIIEQDLISVLSVQISEPQWAGSTKAKLINKNIYIKTKSLVVKNLLNLIKENEGFQKRFKKLFVNDYLFADYKKNHEKIGLPTSDYAKKMLKELFNNPNDYDFIVKQFQEFERLSEGCLKQQAEDG